MKTKLMYRFLSLAIMLGILLSYGMPAWANPNPPQENVPDGISKEPIIKNIFAGDEIPMAVTAATIISLPAQYESGCEWLWGPEDQYCWSIDIPVTVDCGDYSGQVTLTLWQGSWGVSIMTPNACTAGEQVTIGVPSRSSTPGGIYFVDGPAQIKLGSQTVPIELLVQENWHYSQTLAGDDTLTINAVMSSTSNLTATCTMETWITSYEGIATTVITWGTNLPPQWTGQIEREFAYNGKLHARVGTQCCDQNGYCYLRRPGPNGYEDIYRYPVYLPLIIR